MGSSAASTADCNGCGNGKTIHVLLENWGQPQAQQTAWENLVSAAFKAATGANVSFTEYVGSTGELTAIETDSASQSGPDVFQVANSLVATADSAGVFQTITPDEWTLLGGQSRFLPLATSASLTGGTMVAQWLSDTLLAYNTKLFAQAGITSPPTTWNDFVTDAQKITALGNGTYGVGFDPLDPYDPWHEIYLMVKQRGGDLVDATASSAPSRLNTAPVQAAVNFWFDFYNKFKIAPPQSLTWTQAQEMASFAQGKLGMLLLTTAQVNSVSKGQPAEGNIAFAGMPSVPYGETSLPTGTTPIQTLSFSWNLGVTKWSSQKDLAYRFLQVATSLPAEQLLATAFNEVPSTVDATAAEQNNAGLADSIKYMAGGAAPPALAYWGVVETAIADATSAISRNLQNGQFSDAVV
ncbi:MAG TPA: extracellular solute-binding protein, partial [Acidothermaceae bacterium]